MMNERINSRGQHTFTSAFHLRHFNECVYVCLSPCARLSVCVVLVYIILLLFIWIQILNRMHSKWQLMILKATKNLIWCGVMTLMAIQYSNNALLIVVSLCHFSINRVRSIVKSRYILKMMCVKRHCKTHRIQLHTNQNQENAILFTPSHFIFHLETSKYLLFSSPLCSKWKEIKKLWTIQSKMNAEFKIEKKTKTKRCAR